MDRERQRLIDVNVGEGAPGGEEAEPDTGRIGGGGVRDDRVGGGGFRAPATDIGGFQTGPTPITPPRIGGGGVRQFPQPSMSTEDRQRVQAAVAFHIGGKLPGIEWTSAVDPITDRFIELAADNPQLVAAVESDVNAMFALTDMEIAERVMRGEPVSEFGDVFDAIVEVSWEVGATDLATRLEADRADAVKGSFGALTQIEVLQIALPEDVGDVAPGQRVTPDTAKAQTFQTLFDVPGAWSYSPTSGVLAVTVGDQTVGVDARPGFDPDNHLDVMAEVVAAQADGRIVGGELTGGQQGNLQVLIEKAHEVGGWLDQHPTVRTTVDNLWEAFTGSSVVGITTRATGGDTRPFESAAERLRDEQGQITEESIRMASIIPFPDDATIAAVARRWIEDNPDLALPDALAEAASMVEENRDQFVSEFESLTQEQLLEELESDVAGRSSVGAALESGIESVVDKMEAWDQFTQWIGVNTIDAVLDQLGGQWALARGDWQEGFEKFSDIFDSPEESTAAEYFDLEGAAADAVNLAVGIGFDPLNVIFPGGKGIRAMARRALTNPKFAPLYLKMGSTRRVIEQIAEGTGPKAVRNVGAMTNLDDPEIIDLVRLGLDPDATVSQVEEVFTRALHKDWLGEGPMRGVHLKTVEGVGRALESIASGANRSPEFMDSVMKMVSQLSSKRSLRLGENQSLNEFADLLTQFFPLWLQHFIDESARNPMRRTLLQAARGARGGLDVVDDARLLNAVHRVPGLDRDTKFTSQIFQTFFGAPGGRSAGVYYELHFEDAMRILTERHAGRILDVDRLMDYAKVDRQTAQYWLKQGADNKIVSELMRQQGVRTEAQLAAKAAAYAQRRADDYLYRFTSSSLVGRGVESGLLFPFARAQVDFLSWWTNHMFKPMTLRLSPDARAALPQVINSAVQTVERIPLNLRAWAKYAHIAAAAENDHPSWIDQAVDTFTFLPLRFGNDFLLDVSPQFGPVSSLLFDWLVDVGAVSEEVEEQFHALFPALDFTEFDEDLPGDFLNRWLPTTNRSLRGFTVGMLRAGYSLAGNDVHTDPGIMGTIANVIGEARTPAATGDFQAALAADLIKNEIWNLTPGSDEWDAALRDIAVDGAVEANKQEWRRDLANRTAPLTGGDREYRALQAFEGLFDDGIFGNLTSAGVLDANDLIEEDGQPRLKAVWDRYQEGEASPEDLAWLDDRLHSAYFAAGDVEVIPGFSYLDYLHLVHPEISVNLVNKSEDSGIPVRSDEHAAFRNKHIGLDGRLQNIPPGDSGREIISEARRRGWLVSRPVEEWATDAAEAVYTSASRTVHAVWEWVSHRTWAQGTKKAIEDKTFVLGEWEADVLGEAGLSVDAGTTFTYGEFHDLLHEFDQRFKVSQVTLTDTLSRGTVYSQLARHNDTYGLGFLEALDEADRQWRDVGVESVRDWSEESKGSVRDAFTEAVDLGYTTLADYEREIQPIFGPLDYTPPEPPPVDELESGIRLSGDELQSLEVVDGDTVSLLLDDGPIRVRLIGLNAPEVTMEGYQEATDNLAEVVAEADEVILAIYQPELLGLTQLSSPGERRLLAWFYVSIDGRDPIPLYDPSVFTADNPRGTGVTGTVVPLMELLEAGQADEASSPAPRAGGP